MKFTALPIAGAFLVELEPRVDARGSFARAFCRREFEEQGIRFEIVQCNLAASKHAGIVRGLHYQEAPAEEQKLIRCIKGGVLDALVDMRARSPSYRAVYHVELTAENRLALFVPSGVAHGYQTLRDDTEVFYMTDEFYAGGLERGVRFSDPAFGIPWPLPPRDMTPRDLEWPLLTGDGA